MTTEDQITSGAAMPKKKQTTPPNGPVGPWNNRVEYGSSGDAFRPREILCGGGPMKDAAVAAFQRLTDAEVTEELITDGEYRLVADRDFDIELVVAQMRRLGFSVDPNHVLFVHGGATRQNGCGHGCTCGGAGAMGANPFFASSMGASPFFASPFFASPFFASPFFASKYQRSGEQPSSARPAMAPENLPVAALPVGAARAFVLDTGLALDLPPFLNTGGHPNTDLGDRDEADESGDGFLDPASGHGTFIAGIIEQLAPGQDVRVARVLSTFGDGDVATIAGRLDDLRTSGLITNQTVINLSFGGYTDDDMPTLEIAIKLVQATGAVVVASAGNDGVCRRTYPACLPGVISVGSIESNGRAYYSNHGDWVRACAPGTDLTSAFFNRYNGAMPGVPDTDPPIDSDLYEAWATWTGTSFSAPVVTAALLRHIALTGGTAEEAVAYVIDNPALLRFPGLGTIVNLAPGM